MNGLPQSNPPELLLALFQQVNERHFDGMLDPPELRWNARLRTSAGRFFAGKRKRLFSPGRAPLIEIASYLLEEQDPETHVRETIAHEMIHYWLWVRRRPYGHTEEFYAKMQQMGARRYNPVPRRRPYRYVYGCLHCQSRFQSRKVLGRLACAQCCKSHGNGKYDERFRLVLIQKLGKLVPILAFWLLSGFGGSRAVESVWLEVADGSLQCQPFKLAEAQAALRLKLKEAGVQVLELEHLVQGKPGEMRMALCGSPTGARFKMRVPATQQARAEEALKPGHAS